MKKTLKRGQYVLTGAGNIDTGDGGRTLGIPPCICIVDTGDEVGVQCTANGKRGTVPSAILLLQPVDGMVGLARSMAVQSDQHNEEKGRSASHLAIWS